MSAAQCQSLIDQLSEFAPVLHPMISPKGRNDTTIYNVISLCHTEEQRHQIILAMERAKKTVRNCSKCHAKTHGESLEVDLDWTISFTTGLYSLQGVHLCCKLCMKVRKFMQQIYNPEDNVVKHFLTTNNIQIGDNSSKILTMKEKSVFQQWFSLCYSLHLFSNYTELETVDSHGTKLDDPTEIVRIVTLLLTKLATTKKRSSPLKTKKEQPKKKFKKQ